MENVLRRNCMLYDTKIDLWRMCCVENVLRRNCMLYDTKIDLWRMCCVGTVLMLYDTKIDLWNVLCVCCMPLNRYICGNVSCMFVCLSVGSYGECIRVRGGCAHSR